MLPIRQCLGLVAVLALWAAPAMGQSVRIVTPQALDATYVTQTPDATLPNEQALSLLGTGALVNTTGTGVLSIYGGAACTNQFIRALDASVAATCDSVSLAADVTGTLAIANGGTGQTTAGAAFNALSPMTALGDLIYGGTAGAGTRLAGNTTTTRKFLRQTGDGTASSAPAWDTITAADVPGSALTKVDDTNVTLTLGGSPNTALLNAASITVGWTGQLAVPRGGTGASSITGLVLGNGTSAMSAYGGTSCTNQFPRSLNASGVATCASVSLTADVTGTLGVANGGTGASSFTAGSIVFATGSVLSEDNANLFWDDANNRLCLSCNSPLLRHDVRGANAKSTTAAVEYLLQVASTDTTNPLALRLGIKTDVTSTARYGAIEVDDAGTKRHLVLQPSGGNVGIGTTGPMATLDVVGPTTVTGSSIQVGSGDDSSAIWKGALALIHNSDTTIATGSSIGISFQPLSSTGSIFYGAAAIRGVRENATANNQDTALTFWTRAGANNITTNTEKMRITSSGNVGLATTSPTKLLSLGGNAAQTIWMERHTTSNTAGNSLTLQAGGATVGATDKAGGDLILAPGIATGTGRGKVQIQSTISGASGTADRNPATHLQIAQGHIETLGTTPTISAGCGSGATIVGNDNNGTITTNATGFGTCTVTFANPWTNTPQCVLNNRSSSGVTRVTSPSATAFTVTGATGGDIVDYICRGRV